MNDFSFNLKRLLSGVNLEELDPNNDKINKNDLCAYVIHRQGNDYSVMDKLWNNETLTKDEELYCEMVQNCLEHFESISSIVYRYEIQNYSKQKLLNEIFLKAKNCHSNQTNFDNKAFWNFTDDPKKWLDYHNDAEYFQWRLSPKRDSYIKKAYKHFNSFQTENEVIVPIGTIFRVDKIDKNIIFISEM
jgi:hypothetical protein